MAQTSLNSTGVASSGSLVLQSNGTTAAVTIDTSQNVGVGTSSPAYKLDVNISSGSVRVRSNTATANSAGYLLGNSYRAWSILSESGAGNFIISDETTAGTPTRLTLDSSGNLGLGVTPSAWSNGKAIEVGVLGSSFWGFAQNETYMLSNTYFNGGWKYAGTGTATRYAQISGQHVWSTSASGTAGNAITFTQAMTLDASGNLGIGTTSPAYKLDVNGRVSYNGAIGEGAATTLSSTGTSLQLGSSSTWTETRFYTGGSERARIDSSGNLLVGKTAANNTAQGAYIGSTGYSAFVATGVVMDVNKVDGDGQLMRIYRNSTQVGNISVSTGATAYNTSSDYRLKHDISPMTGALAKVAALKPVTYKWNEDNSDGEGFIAHELAEVVPHAVTGQKDAVDVDGNPVYQGIDTSFLVATLTAAIQEQQAIITQLQADVAALKA